MSTQSQEAEEIVVTELGTKTTFESQPRKYKISGFQRLGHIQKVLAALDRPKTAKQIAERIRVFPSNIHRTLSQLELAGWVESAGIVHVGHNKPARLWRRRARLVFEDEFRVVPQ